VLFLCKVFINFSNLSVELEQQQRAGASGQRRCFVAEMKRAGGLVGARACGSRTAGGGAARTSPSTPRSCRCRHAMLQNKLRPYFALTMKSVESTQEKSAERNPDLADTRKFQLTFILVYFSIILNF
jgi:hypothetical protein